MREKEVTLPSRTPEAKRDRVSNVRRPAGAAGGGGGVIYLPRFAKEVSGASVFLGVTYLMAVGRVDEPTRAPPTDAYFRSAPATVKKTKSMCRHWAVKNVPL